MSDQALIKVRTDAIDLLGKIVREYEVNVAAGEVGASGTSKAGPLPATRASPTGLLYGRVQSGKTVAMIALSAAAIDNGFKVLVILTSDNVKLVDQTFGRFEALADALIKNGNDSDNWAGDAGHVKSHIEDSGIVFICAKNTQRLSQLRDFLEVIGASNYPAMVLDDEGDQATPDTTLQARKSGKKSPEERSAIHKITVQDSEGRSIRQTLRHHVFLQVTATPYALLLQNTNSDLRPIFTHLLEPGDGYTGGEAFFEGQIVEDEAPPLIFVGDDESVELDKNQDGPPPEGLQKAIAFFLVAAGAQQLVDPSARGAGQNFLCHTSQKIGEHEKLASLIRSYVGQISEDLKTSQNSETMMRFEWAYEELKKTLPQAPPLVEILERNRKRLPRRNVMVINSSGGGGSKFSSELNFVIGGNILGRGLKIPDLLVTYYLRRAKISQMDTVLQHARMYGYRKPLMPYTRVFLPEELAVRFHFIHTAEQNLRRQLSNESSRSKISVEAMDNLRPTRMNVLETSNLAAYRPGEQLYPASAAINRKALAKSADIEKELRTLIGDDLPQREYTPVSPNDFIRMMRLMPFEGDESIRWDPDLLERLLRRVQSHWSQGYVYFRTMSRSPGPSGKPKMLATGALSGAELSEARTHDGPVLACFRDDGKKIAAVRGQSFWYPTLVLPASMPTQVFNVTEE